jgi:hypothetical protein
LLIVNYTPDAQALSIYDYDSCKMRFENLKTIGVYTHIMLFGNSEAARFCISMFEKGIIPREIKDGYEISRLGIQLDFPKNWSGSEINTENVTIAFVIPDKRQSDTMEPLWNMIIIADKSIGEDISDTAFKNVAESLNDVPNFMNTCTFKEPKIVEINEIDFNEDVVVCIDRRLSLFVTISSYSFTAKDNEIFLISAIRHLPSYNPENLAIDFLQTLKVKKIIENIKDEDISKSEIKKSNSPGWLKKYVTLWGEGKITDRQIIYLFNYMIRNDDLNHSHYSSPAFYNAAKVPDWFRHNAVWMDKGLVSEDEFLSTFKYLVKNRIIII